MADGEREETGKRYPLNMRTTREVRGKLESAAVSAGRSLAQEVEFRLEASFHREIIDQVYAGGGITADMLATMAKIIQQIKNSASRRKWSEEDTRDAIRAAVENISSVYLWNGRDKRPDLSEGESLGENTEPMEFGRRAASYHLFWNDDLLHEDATSGIVVNRWSGDGTALKVVVEHAGDGTPPGKKSLKEIMGR